MRFPDLRWRMLAKHGGILLVLGFIAGGIFIWSGFFNVAASSKHWVVTTWILEMVRTRSVETYSYFVPEPPPLDDPDLIRLGAAHYEGGCAPCHSRPGEPINAVVDGMLPSPPLLAGVVGDEDTEELFWIIRHGLKYTGMPAWPAQMRDDEVWALTAFVRRLPGISQAEYRELAGAERTSGAPANGEDLAESSRSVALTQCARCHGDATLPPLSDLVPALQGQSQAYLERALREYAAAARPSGVMQPVAGLLDGDEIRRLAEYYSGLDPVPLPAKDQPDRIRRGRVLAVEGDPERGIPPCLACHSNERADSFPRLAGQYASYLAAQLHVWRDGGRDGTTHGQIMAVVARRLTERQINDAAVYFASIAPGETPVAFGVDAAAVR